MLLMEEVMFSVGPLAMLGVASPSQHFFSLPSLYTLQHSLDRQAFYFPDLLASGGDHVPQCWPMQGLGREKGGHLGKFILRRENHSWRET